MTVAQARRTAGGALVAVWAALAATAVQAQVQPSPVVVELFTSQGCSSCPPADALMADLATQPGVIALALHVDYWDYLGWEDGFASPVFTQRQKRYAKAVGAKMIYTPQMIVAGADRVPGNRPDEVLARIAAHSALAPRVVLQVTRQGGQVVINALADPPLANGAVVQLVRFRPEETVTITRGENAGREVRYHNIVTEWAPVADWPGTAPLDLVVQADGAAPVVVIVQEPGPGAVLAAVRLD